MIGISAYFSALDEAYIKTAAKIGVRYLFTSLHIQEDKNNTNESFRKLLELANDASLILIPDVSPLTFEKCNLEKGDYQGLKNLGITSIRIDYGFTTSEIADLHQMFDIVLNASTVTEKEIKELITRGIDVKSIKVMHNFYPKEETGLSENYFKSMNDLFRKYEMEIIAFVDGDQIKRYPLFQGLPTLEQQRGQNSYVSAVEMKQKYGVSHVIVGDTKASFESLQWMVDYFDREIMHLPVLTKQRELLEMMSTCRREKSDALVRLGGPRGQSVEPNSMKRRTRGSITQENNLAGRYRGEIQIMKIDLGAKESSNVIGYVHPEFLGLIEQIENTSKIKFVFDDYS